MSEQTIRQYAKISEIPLKQVLDVLKNAGFTCNADDVVDKDKRQILSKWYQNSIGKQKSAAKAIEDAKVRAEAETKAKIEAEIKAKEESAKEEEVLAFAEQRVNEILPELKKIGQLLDLCFELLPETQQALIMLETKNKKPLEYIQVNSYLKKYFYARENCRIFQNRNRPKEGCPYDDEEILLYNRLLDACSKAMESNLKINYFCAFYCSEDDIEKLINKLVKQKHYTEALSNVISYILNPWFLTSIKKDINFEQFDFVGELFINMGAIESALKLYEIDQSVFNNPNTLSLLATNAVKLNNLEWAVKLTEQLIKQEPYHPSIPILQADIKRLEQRNRLKSTLSIDFSKIDELSGVEFENLLQDKFAAMGFKVESTPTTGDFGADLILENSEGSRIIVQCKRFKSKVNLKAVQEVVGAMGHYAGDYGVVITNSSFLNSAIKLAESHDIELWDGDKLVSFLAGDLSFSEIVA